MAETAICEILPFSFPFFFADLQRKKNIIKRGLQLPCV